MTILTHQFYVIYNEIYPRSNNHSCGYNFDEDLCNTHSQDLFQKRGCKTIIDSLISNGVKTLLLIAWAI